MSQDPPVPRQDTQSDQGTRPDDVTTAQWGEAEPSRRERAPRWLTGIGNDQRLVPVVAGCGVAAVIASLVGEWTILTVPNAGPDGDSARLPGGVADVANFGTGYLIGLLAIIGSVALMLFGTPAVRHNARVLGLTMAGGVLVLLVAATASLEETTGRLLLGPDDGLRMEYGRGLTMAYLGTSTLGLALLLAGRFVRPPTDLATASSPTGGTGLAATSSPTGADPAAGSRPAGPGQTGGPQRPDRENWPWYRPRPAHDSERDPGHLAPTDLTVGPAAPFIHPEQQDGR